MSEYSDPSLCSAREGEPLLPTLGPKSNVRCRRTPLTRLFSPIAHPSWILPVVLVVSMSRGITLSPRIQVYKTISCRALDRSLEFPGKSSATPSILTDCSGPDVQAYTARLQATVVTLMNILSSISTGFWSQLGDVYGRKPIIALFLFGAIGMEFIHILAMNPSTVFGRNAKSFILIGPILEGIAGAVPSFNGAVHAYTSDCTPHGSRSKIFSTMQGFLFVGLAMGPWLSGFVLPQSAIQVDNAFYLSILLLAATLIYIIVLPESRKRSICVHQEEQPLYETSPGLFLRRYFGRFISALLIPITVFAPRAIPGHPRRKNYNMVLIGISIFIYIASNGVYTIKYLYAQHVYEWTTVQLGYFMSLLWITKAFNLLLLLPFIITYLKPKATPGVIPPPESIAAEMVFDRRLTQCSLGLDCASDALIVLSPSSSQSTFITLSSLSSFSSGGNPALQSLGAVCLHACGSGADVGALFGGIAVLSALPHIISPYIAAFTYSSTVAWFPKAIFLLGAALLGAIIILLSGIGSRPENIFITEPTHSSEDLDTPVDSASVTT